MLLKSQFLCENRVLKAGRKITFGYLQQAGKSPSGGISGLDDGWR